jgi:hypothetical protein
MLDAQYDPACGLITLQSAGFHAIDSITQHAEDVGALVQRLKSEGRDIRILILGEQMTVQGNDVTALAMSRTSEGNLLTGPKDRLAIVLSSMLTKLQIDRFLDQANMRCFSNENEARTWLFSEAA